MKEIKLLETQIEKLDAKGFDLDAWKQYTIVLLSRIFGATDPKIKQIEKIDYDYSSWALRDTSGKSSYMDTCKKLGREILQASVDELTTFGLPSTDLPKDDLIPVSVILEAIEDELKVSQIKSIKEIVNSQDNKAKKVRTLKEIMKSFPIDFAANMIISILSNENLKNKL